jgi:hypothetical protein
MKAAHGLLCFVALLVWGTASGQNNYPKGYFRSPVGYTITLAGSFGEIRRNHFHSGIDFRTEGVQGKPIYAIADGYVSRVNVAAGGFGKALYLAHPNGYTSVYGHLRNFAGPIGSWVKTQQYKNESFAIDTEVQAGVLKVKKGDIIAYSGNSGASGGPHLHFEIRDTKTQETIDPLDFGLMPRDAIPPKVAAVKIYPFDEQAMVNNTGNPVLVPAIGGQGKYSLKVADTLMVSGNVIFGIETSDNSAGSLNTGVHTIVLEIDGMPVYSHSIDRFAFSETRYVNSLIDFPAYIRNKRKIQRSYIAPNNHLRVYGDVVNRGLVHFSDQKVHRVKYTVRDVFGNAATCSFLVKSHPPAPKGGRPGSGSDGKMLSWKTDNHIGHPNLLFDIPKEALYEDLAFEYSVTPATLGAFSKVHHLHNQFTPLHTFCELAIKPETLPAKLQSKAVIVEMEAGNRFSSVGGTFEDGYVRTRIRDFGNYAVMADTTAPVIKPVNIFHNKKVSKQSSIQVKISDNLAGIRSYRGTLNGKWILMDYDAKNRLLVYSFDEHLKPGKNQFVLVVTDGVGNTSKYSATLVR